MRSFSRFLKMAGLLTGLALTACGSTKDQSYQGPVIGTVKGKLTTSGSTAGLTAGQPLRLAVSWILERGVGVSVLGTEVEEQPYQPNFPSDFTINLHHLPPAGATIKAVDGTEVAVGLLLAYEDLNGNGTLDHIPLSGTPVDHVVGASLSFNGQGDQSGLIYAAADSAQLGLKKGFNFANDISIYGSLDGTLVLKSLTVVAAATLQVDGSVRNNLFNCDIDQPLFGSMAHCMCTSPDLVFVDGSISPPKGNEQAGGHLAVADCSGERGDAQVTLNGTTVAFDSGAHDYEMGDSSPIVFGNNALHIAVPGKAALDLNEAAPSLDIQAPQGPLTVGQPATFSWASDAAVGTLFNVGVEGSSGSGWEASTSQHAAVDPALQAGDDVLRVSYDIYDISPNGALSVDVYADDSYQLEPTQP